VTLRIIDAQSRRLVSASLMQRVSRVSMGNGRLPVSTISRVGNSPHCWSQGANFPLQITLQIWIHNQKGYSNHVRNLYCIKKAKNPSHVCVSLISKINYFVQALDAALKLGEHFFKIL
jgi:hypothetical protein